MRVAIANFRSISDRDSGGAEVFLEKFMEALINKGHEVSFYSPKLDNQYPKRANPDVNYVKVGVKHFCYRRIRQEIGRQEWDLLIDSVNVRGFNLYKLSSKHRTIIYQTAEEIWSTHFFRLLAFIGKVFLEPYWLGKYRNANVITISNSVKEDLLRFGIKNIKVIPPGLNEIQSKADRTNSSNFKDIKLVFCARLVAMKQPMHAIKVFNKLGEIFPNSRITLKILGDGPLFDEVSKAAARYGDKISVQGYVSPEKKLEIFQASDFLLATSVREGWGLTVSEAAAMGCIPVGYNVSGLRDSVNYANGLLTPPNPIDMAVAISKLILSDSKPAPSKNGGLENWHSVARQIIEPFN